MRFERGEAGSHGHSFLPGVARSERRCCSCSSRAAPCLGTRCSCQCSATNASVNNRRHHHHAGPKRYMHSHFPACGQSHWKHCYCAEWIASSGKSTAISSFLQPLFPFFRLSFPLSFHFPVEKQGVQPRRSGKNRLLGRSFTGPGIFAKRSDFYLGGVLQQNLQRSVLGWNAVTCRGRCYTALWLPCASSDRLG